MGPPEMIPLERRQTFLPEKFNGTDADKENQVAADRRTTFQPSDLDNRFGSTMRRETFVKLPSSQSWTPQKLVTNAMDRRKWDPAPVHLGDLSGLVGLEETLESCAANDDSILFRGDKYCLSPSKDLTIKKDEEDSIKLPEILISEAIQQPLNLSLKKECKVYQPDVSDISLAEVSLNMSENEAGMSMAVNLSEYRSERVKDLDLDLEELEDRDIEEEIDRLAVARAASSCR